MKLQYLWPQRIHELNSIKLQQQVVSQEGTQHLFIKYVRERQQTHYYVYTNTTNTNTTAAATTTTTSTPAAAATPE